jgi:predicted alpha/beta hydrolase
VAVLAHAIMARRSEFHRPAGASFASFLVERGWRVVAFDFRGHGDSGPAPREGATYGYDDFVSRDLSAVCEFAREQADEGGGDGPVVVVGHSLGGHAAIVAQGIGAIGVDAIAGVAAAPPFLRAHEPSVARWIAKRAAIGSMLAVARRVGRFPTRALRLGSDDVATACCEDFDRFARTDRWASRDGRHDYMAALGRVRIPVLQIVSEGDRFECVPECGERLAQAVGSREPVLRVGATADGPAPSHMGLMTSRRSRPAWEGIEAWMRRATTLNTPDARPRSGRSFRD